MSESTKLDELRTPDGTADLNTYQLTTAEMCRKLGILYLAGDEVTGIRLAGSDGKTVEVTVRNNHPPRERMGGWR